MHARNWTGNAGLTLLEVLVVLIVMGIAVGLAMPVFLRDATVDEEFGFLLRSVRTTAARRGEMLDLHIQESGQWRLYGTGPLEEGAIASGAMSDYSGPEATLIISPIGTCAYDVRSSAAERLVRIDPLGCEVAEP